MKSKHDHNGIAFIAAGVLLVAAAICLIINNVRDDLLAGSSSQSAVDTLMPMIYEIHTTGNGGAALPPTVIDVEPQEIPDMPTQLVNGIEYVAVISLPSLGLELPVAADWDYRLLDICPCRYTGSAYDNSMVICAHNYDSHFGRLKELSVGDEIILIDMDGSVFRYEVSDLEILQPSAVDEMISSDYDLSLFTCTIGGRTRVTVRCDRIYE